MMKMTDKLYYKDSMLFEFTAVVTEKYRDGSRWALVTDSTAFFPTGGGQNYDEGLLGGCTVSEVVENGGTVIHYFDQEPDFSVGDEIKGKLDSELRFRRMQSHTGEHIVSGIAHNLYGAENVGFHMDGTLMTVDFDIVLSSAQIKRIEELANECVYSDVPVSAEIFTPEEAEHLTYRSKKEFTSDIRIVTVEGIDRCACCAPHLKSTGQVGLIKILSCVSHRGGVRITLVCGKTAYEDYSLKYDNVLACADLMKVKHAEIASGIERLMAQINDLKTVINEQKRIICERIIDSFTYSGGNAVFFVDNADMEELRMLSLGAADKFRTLAAVFCGNDENGYSYVITCRGQIMNKFAKVFNSALNGRGGGRDEMIQGSFAAAREEIEKYFAEFEVN